MSELVSILEGSTFVVGDRRGDLDASPADPHGLFHRDTRYLSRWVLTLDGQRPNVLSVDEVSHSSAQHFLVPGTGTVYVDATLTLVRRRVIGGGFREEIVVANHANHEVEVTLRVEVASDFADLFEVKDKLAKKGDFYQRVEERALVLGYRRDRFLRETHIRVDKPALVDERGLTVRLELPPHGLRTVGFDVAAVDGRWERARPPRFDPVAAGAAGRVETWENPSPRLTSSWRALERTYQRSIDDLAALRFYSLLAPDSALPAAGLPWFMALFGRDAILTSLQSLAFHPALARTTLRVLGLRQGTRFDPFRDEEPGKILHESRQGELTAFEERPHSPYFGSADATPLWLVLLDEYERWSGDTTLVMSLEREARLALRWMDEWGDRDGDGYIEYERRMPTGLDNQCWKDSWNSIQFRDGTIAPVPRATCEIQGYAYDARRRAARLAREVWRDQALAERLDAQADLLKRRFNQDFWIAERGYFALALDGKKRQVDALTSNLGHLLWSGIVDDDKVELCVRHLMSDALFSGWGVRTLAAGQGGYNPVGYHVGTVWPFDNAIIALGLRRAGYRSEATRIAAGILDAAVYFAHRLPEAFAGLRRDETRFPVEYPTACSPQAWSSGTPLLLLQVLLGLQPVAGRLLVDPALPDGIEWLELLDVPGRWGLADAFARRREGQPATDGGLPLQEGPRR
jgi:glycogen debranching enzyme